MDLRTVQFFTKVFLKIELSRGGKNIVNFLDKMELLQYNNLYSRLSNEIQWMRNTRNIINKWIAFFFTSACIPVQVPLMLLLALSWLCPRQFSMLMSFSFKKLSKHKARFPSVWRVIWIKTTKRSTGPSLFTYLKILIDPYR